MKLILAILLLVICAALVSNVEAHKAVVLDDFKIDVGWKKEPPIQGEANAIEIIVKLASNYEKQRLDTIDGKIIDVERKSSGSDVKDLEDDLEVDITLAGKKDFLKLKEDTKFPGVYHGEFTPHATGHAKVHIYGIIKNLEFEATFDPEKIEQGTMDEIPDWVKNNAGWWSEGKIGDADFVNGIQFLIKEGVIHVTATKSTESASHDIPSWIRNNAGWWSEGKIGDADFTKGIEFLIQNGIIRM